MVPLPPVPYPILPGAMAAVNKESPAFVQLSSFTDMRNPIDPYLSDLYGISCGNGINVKYENTLRGEKKALLWYKKVYVITNPFFKCPFQGASLPVMDLTELPKCTVCLERMDESVNGILTTLCNHSFHSQCLQRWEDTT